MQHAYLMLRTQPNVSPAGVLSLHLNDWAQLSRGRTSDDIAEALQNLQTNHFIAYDTATDELIIRGWIRDEPSVTGTVAAVGLLRLAARDIGSATLRGCLYRDVAQLVSKDVVPAKVRPHLLGLATWLEENLGLNGSTQCELFASMSPADTGDIDDRAEAPKLTVGQASEPVNGRVLVGRWVDGYRTSHSGQQPDPAMVGQFAASTRSSLRTGIYSDEDLVRAAELSGQQGWTQLAIGLERLTRLKANSTVSYQNTDAPTSVAVVSMAADLEQLAVNARARR